MYRPRLWILIQSYNLLAVDMGRLFNNYVPQFANLKIILAVTSQGDIDI